MLIGTNQQNNFDIQLTELQPGNELLQVSLILRGGLGSKVSA